MTDSQSAAPLNLAFLGCGEATRLHSRTLSGPGFRINRFYASREPERAREYDKRFHGSGWFHSYEAAIRDDRIQVLLVATPPPSHLEWTLRALDAGKDVIVEKPAFLRAKDFQAVKASAQRRDRNVFVAENYVYKPLAHRLRDLLGSGVLGEVRFLQVNALKEQVSTGWRRDEAEAGGGALFEGGIHWVSFLGSLGLDVLSSWGQRAGNTAGTDRSAVVVFRYHQGAVGTLHFSWEIPAPFRGVRLSRIYGTAGSVLFESNGLFLISRSHGSSRRLLPRIGFPGVRDLLGYRAMFCDFFRAVRTGTPPFYTLDAAEKDLARIEEIYRAMDGGPADPHRNTCWRLK